jgi:hypothetical protein
MKASEEAKNAGLKNLKELGEITGLNVVTLINWLKNRPKAFKALVLGAAKIKQDSIN